MAMRGQQLDDRTTRGEALSDEERAMLHSWYARQDREEGYLLEQGNGIATLVGLQAQVDAAVRQLSSVTERIQAINAENEAVRHEIASFKS
jgi:hypothetical protein